jgi:ABC-type bacteriocin/lantibiotic exporter with double-glycine peptidase domain
MALAHQGIEMGEQELCDLLETHLAGTEVWNLLLLEKRVAGCQVHLDSLSYDRLEESLAADVPPIAFVDTRHLTYWHHDTIHAVLVVGVTDDEVHVNDPVFADAPRVVSRREFSLAWSELDHLAAILTVNRNRE